MLFVRVDMNESVYEYQTLREANERAKLDYSELKDSNRDIHVFVCKGYSEDSFWTRPNYFNEKNYIEEN